MLATRETEFTDRKMLYRQTKDYILDKIQQGIYGPGELIPPERELAEQLNISRYTVRRAIQELVAEGILHRVQGSGTYVTEPTNNVQRSDTLGIVMPFSDAEVEMLLLNGMQKALRDTRFSMTIRGTGNSAVREWDEVQRLKEEGVSGLIIMPSEEEDGGRSAVALKREGFPFVLIDRKVPGCETNCVMSDNIQGGYLSAKYLYDLGHRKIAFVKHRSDNTSSAKDRFLGYRKAFQETGLGDGTLFAFDYRNGEEELQQFLLSGEYTAFIAVNGYVAVDIIKACRATNLVIPDDLSLISFDDPSILHHLEVSLTTVIQHTEMIGYRAVRLLIEEISNQEKCGRDYIRSYTQCYYPVRLIERESCRRLDSTGMEVQHGQNH